MQRLYENIFYHEKVNTLFSDEAMVGYMLRFEGALTKAQASHALIPGDAAAVIESCCRADRININQLIAHAASGGNAAIPLIRQLTELVRQKDAEACKYVHAGATSQDVIDTAIMLQAKDAVDIMLADLQQLIAQLISLTEEHGATVMIGRTFMQQARPITFGCKTAGWLQPLLRSHKAIKALLRSGFVLQLGGAVGSLSGMREKGLQVSETMGGLLGLNNPSKPWHTERDYVVAIATTLGMLTGNTGKMAKDISLLMQTEIAEVMEPAAEGKGGSSTMPHKRNPVGCMAILANAARVPALVATMFTCMVQDHERATGLWHAEWETLSGIVQLTAGCVRRAVELTNGLEIKKAHMHRNLDATQGLVYAENASFALAEKIGRSAAHAVIEQCSREAGEKQIHLRELLLSRPDIVAHLGSAAIEALFDPSSSAGLCATFSQVVCKEGYAALHEKFNP